MFRQKEVSPSKTSQRLPDWACTVALLSQRNNGSFSAHGPRCRDVLEHGAGSESLSGDCETQGMFHLRPSTGVKLTWIGQ